MSKVCLVVGVTSGLGRSCGENLAKDYNFIVAGRNQSKGSSVVDAITKKGGEATLIPFDITDPAFIVNLHKQTLAEYRRLDAAISGAGILKSMAKIADTPPEEMSELWTVNVVGAFLCMKEQIRAMQGNRGGSGGHVVNFSSIYGVYGCKFSVSYSTSKRALIG